jgi:hypothetical protein
MKMNYKILSIALGAAVLVLTGTLLTVVRSENEATKASVEQQIESKTPTETEPPAPEAEKPATNSVDMKTIPWKLTKGDVTDTCTSPTFTGQVTLKGRYVWDTSYVANQWLFEISPDQLKLLPLAQLKLGSYYEDKPQFVLQNVSADLEEQLKNATDFEPQEITITQFNQYCEGSANLKVK